MKNNSYEQYKKLYRAEVSSLQAKGVEVPKDLQKPLSEIEFRFRVASEEGNLFGEDANFTRRLVDEGLYRRSEKQAKKIVEAMERANEMFGTNFNFSEQDVRLAGFDEGKGAEFWNLVKETYYTQAAAYGTVAAKAYIAKVFFGSD